LALNQTEGMIMLRSALTISVILICQSVLASTVVFDNIGPTYSLVGCWFGDAGFTNNVATMACDFCPDQSGGFDEVWAEINMVYPSDPLIFNLMDDNSGLPGNIIWSSITTNQAGTLNSHSILHFNNLDGPLITAGQRYWLTAAILNPDSHHFGVWTENTLGDCGIIAVSKNGGPWRQNSFQDTTTGLVNERLAMRIGIVAEPSSVFLLGVAVMSLLVWRNHASCNFTRKIW
jgi:hypothetical protein